ncbi:MAG TPA: caspase family protein [Pyrinomonadaceae bacterium]|nr:caspase family protein [Pyrinomonadaceae bacterium]
MNFRQVFVTLGLLILLSFGFIPEIATKSQPVSKAQSKPEIAKELKKFVYQVGIDRYKYVPPLDGCVQDLLDMKEILMRKFSVPENNFLAITNEEATHQAILAGFRKHLIENAKANPNAIVIFQFSGHGSRVPDQDGDKPDGMDSTLVPVDSRDPENKNFDIVDYQIRDLFEELSRYTNNITFIIDACHSGNPTRGGKTRGIRIDTRKQPPSKARKSATRDSSGTRESEVVPLLARDQRYVSIAATLPHELAHEKTVIKGEKENGALTYHLIRALERAAPETTYRQLMEEVSNAVTIDFPSQHPQAEGDLRRRVFAGSATREDSFIRIDQVKDGEAIIKAGTAHGLRSGSVVAFYASDATRLAGEAKKLSTGTVTEVEAFSARVKLDPAETVTEKAKAVLVSPDFGSVRTRVVLPIETTRTATPNASLRNSVADLLKDSQRVEILPSSTTTQAAGSEWDVAVMRDKINNVFRQVPTVEGAETLSPDREVYYIAGQGGLPVFGVFVELNDPQAATKIATALEYLANQRALLAVRNEATQLGGAINIIVRRVHGDFSEGRGRIDREEVVQLAENQKDYAFDQGEYFRFELENRSDRDLYVTLFDIAPDGSIQILYPPKGATIKIPKGEKVRLNEVFETTGPAGYETFKVIASTEQKGPSDFEFLEQTALTRTRSKRVSIQELADWTTSQINFVISERVVSR